MKNASEWASTITEKATLRSTPATLARAKPKSTWACPDLGLPWLVNQWHENLTLHTAYLTDSLFDLGVAALITFLPDALKYPLGAASLENSCRC